MKETPIIMQAESVRAILDGTKTMTRRTYGLEFINKEPGKWQFLWEQDGIYFFTQDAKKAQTGWHCPYGQVGDRLWVRETWWDFGFYAEHLQGEWVGLLPDMTGIRPQYYADTNIEPENPTKKLVYQWRKRPSIHMPRWASRVTLEITKVRVERVQEISWQDAKAEGIPFAVTRLGYGTPQLGLYETPQEAFEVLWDSIYAKRGHGWDTNPWVFVISFRRI